MFRAAALFVLVLIVTPAPAVAGEWREIQNAYDRTFQPLPVDRMWTDLEKELKSSRQHPFSGPALTKLRKERMAQQVKRAQIIEARREREKVVKLLASSDDPRATPLLIEAYDLVLAEVDIAVTVLDRHREMRARRFNPGTDPGGFDFGRWMEKDPMAAAYGVLRDERKLRDLIVESLNSARTPEVREWLVANAGKGRPDVRDRMARILAASEDPLDLVALDEMLARERSVWARVMIVGALGDGGRFDAAPLVLRALADKAWPVREAAIASIRKLGFRDAGAILALLAALEKEEGRLRLELRDALVEATGRTFGLSYAQWADWWGSMSSFWTAPPAPAAVVALPDDEEIGRLLGIPTASKRIVFLVSRSTAMAQPARCRETDNEGRPSPEPLVDTAMKIATWELEQALATIPHDAEFNVIVYGAKLHQWSKQLKKASKDSKQKAVKFVRQFKPEGGSAPGAALEAALSIDLPRGVTDLALGEGGGIDTICVIGDGYGSAGRLASRDGLKAECARIFRLRRVIVHAIIATKGTGVVHDIVRASGGWIRTLDRP